MLPLHRADFGAKAALVCGCAALRLRELTAILDRLTYTNIMKGVARGLGD